MKHKLIPRVLITLLGLALILMGVSEFMLGRVGESASGVITHIRREGGERTDNRSGRYTYNISYTFTLPDGKKVDGFTKSIGDSVYLKADGTSRVTVRYLSVLPYINTMERYAGFGPGQAILVLAGVFLIFFMNRGER